MKKRTYYEFVEIANIKHNYKYKYPKFIYENNKQKIKIICPKHGEFYQRIVNHLRGQGCPYCANRYVTTEDFINKAKKIHNDEYSYNKTIYTGAYNKVIITCKKHGDFVQVAHDHLSGYGCPMCKTVNSTRLNGNTILYLVELVGYKIYKIGIISSKFTIEYRLRKDIKKGIKFNIIKTWCFLKKDYAAIAEYNIMLKYSKNFGKILTSGNTELIQPKKGQTYEEFIQDIDAIVYKSSTICK